MSEDVFQDYLLKHAGQGSSQVQRAAAMLLARKATNERKKLKKLCCFSLSAVIHLLGAARSTAALCKQFRALHVPLWIK